MNATYNIKISKKESCIFWNTKIAKNEILYSEEYKIDQ